MSDLTPAIIGYGYSVPDKIRFNNDPIFDYLHKHTTPGENLFKGYYERRVLADDQTLMDIMVPAAKMAMESAGIGVHEIDFLLGVASMSTYIEPNDLFQLHQLLGLGKHVWPIPVGDDFSNFNSSILLADALIRIGRAKNILICVGGDWTRNVNYETAQAISAADGAGAIVISGDPKYKDKREWVLMDSHTDTDTGYFGSMYSLGDEISLSVPQGDFKSLFTSPYFHITDKGITGFQTFGMNAPPQCTKQLLARNNVSSSDVCLISHQASDTLLSAWGKAIEPGFYFDTIKLLANMALANVPVNFAVAMERDVISLPYLVLLTIGPDMHTNAMLFKRPSD